MKQLPKTLSQTYDLIKEQRLPYRRFKHQQVLYLIEQYRIHDMITIKEEGRSIEGRIIQSLTIGSGQKKIIVWTQMHGNEPTATRAVFDFLSFIKSDYLTSEYQDLLNEVQIKFVPVVNPDGLERYQRRNALDIDPNRDAAKITTPEIQMLFNLVEDFQPDWCFNMHDQRNLFNVGNTSEPASLSFLSPSTADGVRGEVQREGMMMIDKIHQCLSEFIPNKIGRFTHEFYPTASGDNFQTLGYRTILVESGGHRNDVEREIPRKMNFMLLWETIRLVATDEWQKGTVLRYSEIPANDLKMFDLLIRNATLKLNGIKLQADLGIDRVEIAATNDAGFVYKSTIRDLGDLSYSYGYEELDASSFVVKGRIRLNQLAEFDLMNEEGEMIHIKNGFVV
ncbi:MAG: M14 family zinc carboxypeptidase [Salibacteraceae bacterium]